MYLGAFYVSILYLHMTDDINTTKIAKYNCNVCEFTCSKKCEWIRHQTTRKHQTTDEYLQSYNCICGKNYRHRQSLHNHKKKCNGIELNNVITLAPVISENNIKPTITNDMLLTIIEQNHELQKQILELAKEPKIINHYNGDINNNQQKTNNTQFNMNVFLNEDCKNAMSINQFIESIKLNVNDLEETGRLGFIDGISRIILNALKGLDLKSRPIHCTDSKRETIYIKDEEKWEKEGSEKTKLITVLRQIEKKNIRMLPEWMALNPECRIMDTPEAKQYVKIYLSSLGQPDKEGIEKQDEKIIRNVLKEVVLDKGKI